MLSYMDNSGILEGIMKKQEILEKKIRIIEKYLKNMGTELKEIESDDHDKGLDQSLDTVASLDEGLDKSLDQSLDESLDEGLDEGLDESLDKSSLDLSNLKYPSDDLPTELEYLVNGMDTELTVYTCVFQINREQYEPFVLYDTVIKDDKICFPSKTMLPAELEPYRAESKDTYRGYIHKEDAPNVIYLIFEKNSENDAVSATINELYNLKRINNHKVDDSVIRFFEKNEPLVLYIYADTKKVDIPFSGYLCDVDDAGNVKNVALENEDDMPLLEMDILKIGLMGEYYYLSSFLVDPAIVVPRYVIFPSNRVMFGEVDEYDDYNSIFYKTANNSFWAITSASLIAKI